MKRICLVINNKNTGNKFYKTIIFIMKNIIYGPFILIFSVKKLIYENECDQKIWHWNYKMLNGVYVKRTVDIPTI